MIFMGNNNMESEIMNGIGDIKESITKLTDQVKITNGKVVELEKSDIKTNARIDLIKKARKVEHYYKDKIEGMTRGKAMILFGLAQAIFIVVFTIWITNRLG